MHLNYITETNWFILLYSIDHTTYIIYIHIYTRALPHAPMHTHMHAHMHWGFITILCN